MSHDDIKKLLEGITQGEWEVKPTDFAEVTVKNSEPEGLHNGHFVATASTSGLKHTIGEMNRNAIFIAAAPSIVRQLLEEVERLELDICGHGYCLDILRKQVGLPSGESYQEVYAAIIKLQEEIKTLRGE